MSNYSIKMINNDSDHKERSRRLAAVYNLVLYAWPEPQRTTADPDDLGEETGTAVKSAPAEEQDAS